MKDKLADHHAATDERFTSEKAAQVANHFSMYRGGS